MMTLSSNKITTDYCSALEKDRLVNWDKNSSQFEYQYNQPSEFKAATSLLRNILSRRFEEKIRVRKKCNPKFKYKKKFKYCSKSQIFESPLGSEISIFKPKHLINQKHYQRFQISESPLGLGIHRTNFRKFSKLDNWRFRTMRISGWLYDILFSMLICLLYTSPSPRDS